MSTAPKITAFRFDASQVEPAKPMEVFPAGDYLLEITDGERKPNSNGDGELIEFEYTILDGEHKGRKVFDRLNVVNQSAQAQLIAQQQLSAICHATGVIQMEDISQLFGKPFIGVIGLEGKRTIDNIDKKKAVPEGSPNSTTYQARNVFKGAKSANGTTPSTAGAAPAGKIPSWAPSAPGTTAAAAPTAPAKPAGPTAPTAPAAAKKPSGPTAPVKPAGPEREFFLFLGENNMPLKKESEVIAMFAKGMPVDTQMSLADANHGFVNKNGWKTAADLKIGAAPAASNPAPTPTAPAAVAQAETTAAPAAEDEVPPWMR